MISAFKLFRRYFITLTILIIAIQVIISFFILFDSYISIKKNTGTLMHFVSIALMEYDREVMRKMNLVSSLFNDIKHDLIKKNHHNIDDILKKIEKIDNPQNFSIAFINDEGKIVDTNLKEEKGLNLFQLPDAKVRLTEAKETEVLYLYFPVYNPQNNSFFAYLLQYLTEKNLFLQMGYKIDILNDLLNKVAILDTIQDYSYRFSIYNMSKIGETYLLIPLKGGKSFTQDDGNKKIYSDILNKMTKSKLFEYDESSFLKIRMAHIITKKDWSSPYGIFYVIEINPNVTGTIRNILIINIIFVLIYIILYFYYNVTIKKNFVKPLQKITEEISNSTPIVDQKSSNVLEIERLRNSYLEHLENIKLRDLLKEVFIAQENERERISKNLHDTILQDLSYILIELSRNGQKTLGDILKNSIKNLRTLLIETDMFKLKKFGLEAFLNEFMEEMMYRFQSIDFFHEIALSNVDLDEEKNLLIARIVKELLLNAAVHSGGKNIFMAVKRLDNEIVITVKDNGVGFDLDKGFNKKGHLGLKLIRERVYILKGNLKISTKDGTEVVIRIPIDEDIKDS
ncbi:MAG: hypothetical protein C0187_04650 [Calditerrivibrio nitroreducens]|uniref:histidine kinase n=1 Tax=Calditerrivibrio nitroreducens TaxID=477976 RepID=A0A2J6WKV4_9BACT|nr:MAG: hypothetical protein C0187_04650 [Calditerrivibrio nitroreducens]